MNLSLTARLIAHLNRCPCCKAPAQTFSKPADGIPDEHVHETLFMCGARIFVSNKDDFCVSSGCPYPADDALQDYRRDVIDAIEGEGGEAL